MHRSFRHAVLASAMVAAAPLSALGQNMAIDVVGGGIGQTMTLTVSVPPNAQYLTIMSLTTGPTALPAPHIASLDVGFELLELSVSIPGFLGVLPPGGSIALPLPIPNVPGIDNLNLNFQSTRIDFGTTIAQKSNLWRVTFDLPGEWASTLNGLLAARAFPTATKLADGRVLVAGGGQGSLTGASGLATAELYRPNLELFEPTGTMNSARALHRATLLNDGRVFVSGGVDALGNVLNTAEIYDPATGVFTATPPMSSARVGHTATRLPDGRVFVAGGSSSLADSTAFYSSAQSTTVIYNPTTNTWSNGPGLGEPKTFHDAVALADGRVFLSGGITFINFIVIIPSISAKSALYNPTNNTIVTNLTLPAARAAHSSILLNDGRVLVVGGAGGSILAPTVLSSCDLYTPSSNSFQSAGAMTTPLAITSLAKLPNGTILAAGGAQGSLTAPTPVADALIYTPAVGGAGSWVATNPMSTTRSGAPAVLLNDLSVLVVGGGGGPSNTALQSAEVHQP